MPPVVNKTGYKYMQQEEEKVEFEKEETVPSSKYNQTVRKLRENEAEARELKAKIAELESKSESTDDDDEEELFDSKSKLDKLVEEKIKPLQEALTQREAEDKKSQRSKFFRAHPEYEDAEKWQELLDEVENFNPNIGYYEALNKAHKILSGGTSYSIDKKKAELASEMAGAGEGAEKIGVKKIDPVQQRYMETLPKIRK
jgi:DNA-directed RNA polymerase